MAYIHELKQWPSFSWDAQALATTLSGVRHKQGRLLGKMETMGFELRSEASLTAITHDIVKSSAIEGESLEALQVRSSIAGRLGLDVAGLVKVPRHVEGIVELMLDATQNHNHTLDENRLFAWHSALFTSGRNRMSRILTGAWRNTGSEPMQVVSGPVGRERIHFQAPHAKRVPAEMKLFLDWFNQPPMIDPVLKAAIAHFWFVTIHPFEDGNGRIARAIADMCLARADGSSERFYSMSTRIETERSEYYIQLESAQRGSLDITAWLAWFLGCLDRAMDSSEDMLAGVWRNAKIWQMINSKPVNERQRLVLNRITGDFRGHLNTSKYAKMAKCSHDTALRDIRELLAHAILVKNESGGRSTSYRLNL